MFKKKFEVANPSPYERSDYVEVDLQTLGVPTHLGENSLILFRLDGENKIGDPVPFQIDSIMGPKNDRRFMVFQSTHTPPGQEDYSMASAKYVLEEGKSLFPVKRKADLWVGHYYQKRGKDEPSDGFNREWQEGRAVKGVKLFNNCIEFFLSLVPHTFQGQNFTGALTYLHLESARWECGVGEMLAEDWQYPFKRWGQLTQLAFFPLPWRTEWFQKISLLDKGYDLVYSHSGPIRALVTLKSEELDISFNGSPYFKPGHKVFKSNLYRIIYVYPGTPFYTEVIFVKTHSGESLSFRPYYSSLVHHPSALSSQLHKNVDYTEYGDCYIANPSFFALWKYVPGGARGFAFASNIRIRSLELIKGEVQWRIANSHHNKCVHYFMYENDPAPWKSPLHTIGHDGWYLNIYKPLEVIPLTMRYPTHHGHQPRGGKEVIQHGF